MDRLLIKGGTRQQGDVTISGAKNAALPILAGTLLASEPVTISNVPQLNDVATMLTLLQSMGVEVTLDDQMNVESNAGNVSKRLRSEWHKHRGMVRYFRRHIAPESPTVVRLIWPLVIWSHFLMAAPWYWLRNRS